MRIRCKKCFNEYHIEVTKEQIYKYQNGTDLIQNIFPELPPHIRELFISGFCPTCWNEIFKEDEN